MRKNQVCVADDPKAHTTKFVNVKDLILDEEKGLTLGQFLTSQTNKIEKLEEEVNSLTRTYRQNTKKLLNIIEILVNQTELNNMNINDLKSIKEEVEND